MTQVVSGMHIVYKFLLFIAWSFWPHLVMLSEVAPDMYATIHPPFIQQTLYCGLIMFRVLWGLLSYIGKIHLCVSPCPERWKASVFVTLNWFLPLKNLYNSNSLNSCLSYENNHLTLFICLVSLQFILFTTARLFLKSTL